MTGVERVDSKSSAKAMNNNTESGVAGFSSMAAVTIESQIQDYRRGL